MTNQFVLFIYFGIGNFLNEIKFQTLAAGNSYTCEFVESLKLINCSSKILPWLPTGLRDDITTMDLTSADLQREPFNSTTFKNYPKLVHLIARITRFHDTTCFIRPGPTPTYDCLPKLIAPDAFSPLKALQSVDFSYSAVNFSASFKWPATMKIIHLDFTKIELVPSMADLEHLEDFSFINGSLKLLPKFNKEAPIQRIELSNNPLNEVNVSDIAPFCHLKYLGILVSKEGNFSKKENFCSCNRLRKWVKRVDISGAELLICDNGGNNFAEKGCKEDMTFRKEDKMYNECWRKIHGSNLWELLLFAVAFALLFPVLFFANKFCNNLFAASAEKRRSQSRSKTDSDESTSGVAESPSETDENDLSLLPEEEEE